MLFVKRLPAITRGHGITLKSLVKIKVRTVDPLSKNVVTPVHSVLVAGRRAERLSLALAKILPADCKQGLDIGCGDGAIATLLQSHVPGISIVGVDTLARPNALIAVEKYDGEVLPYADNSFDFSMIVDVLHHTTNPLPVLQEAVRVSRRCVLIKDHYCENKIDFEILQFMDWVGNKGHGVVLTNNYQSRSQWKELYSKSNLQTATVNEKLDLYPWPFSLVFDRDLHFVTALTKITNA